MRLIDRLAEEDTAALAETRAREAMLREQRLAAAAAARQAEELRVAPVRRETTELARMVALGAIAFIGASLALNTFLNSYLDSVIVTNPPNGTHTAMQNSLSDLAPWRPAQIAAGIVALLLVAAARSIKTTTGAHAVSLLAAVCGIAVCASGILVGIYLGMSTSLEEFSDPPKWMKIGPWVAFFLYLPVLLGLVVAALSMVWTALQSLWRLASQ
ncbi:MAG: hypothetical protein ACKVUT_18335 [Gaiella sp.]